MRIGIIDYGLGNLRSVAGSLSYIGVDPVMVSSPDQFDTVDRLILPGVGAFGDGMAGLTQRNLIPTLNHLVIDRRIPILGICLGAQLIAKEGLEFGHHEGLGWIDARVEPIPQGDPQFRIPHMGWNEVTKHQACPLTAGLPEKPIFYFVHSYRIVPRNDKHLVASCEHGCKVAAILQCSNIFAVQFHPEKSQADGLALLKNFVSGDLHA